MTIPEIMVDIAFDPDDRAAWSISGPEDCVVAAIEAVWKAVSSHQAAEISVLMTDDARMKTLNAHYRGIDKPTNVLSFPQIENALTEIGKSSSAGPALHLGDIALARETCLREAQDFGLAPGDHVTHLTIHGFLHLLGYDHQIDSTAELMEALEIEILATLGLDNPYRAKPRSIEN